MKATGTFQITTWDQSSWDDNPGGTFALARVTKEFTGDVEGTSVARVLTAETSAGPAAYTAQERFTGSIGGKAGTFMAQHGATSPDGGAALVIIAGSGSGALAGLSGTGSLEIQPDGTHTVSFDYEIVKPAG